MDFTVNPITGTAERDAVPEFLDGIWERGYRHRTLGTDYGNDTRDCVRDIRARQVTPHVTQRQHSAIDERTTRHTSYVVSLRLHKRGEEVFGWMKTVDGSRRTHYRGVADYLVMTSCNLACMTNFKSEPETAAVPPA